MISKSAPVFPLRGFHLDLRIQAMPMPAVKQYADELAGLGINALVMEYEATFPFVKHNVISNRYAYTAAEIRSLVSYCEKRGIQVIPLQQCFGHSEYILRHPRYADIREDRKEISQVCPLKEKGAKALFTELFTEMAALHPSKYFHIGGDETYLLGNCPACREKATRLGKSRLFVDYMVMICNILKKLKKRPVLWADIILKYPEAIKRLPRETVFIDWNYGWKFDQHGDVPAAQRKGCEFWGSPALRSHPDNWYLTSWEKHFNNLRDFIPRARSLGYTGVVMTSWSTSGIYGYEWDTDYEMVDMHTIRHVYPLSGFRILLHAYIEAINRSRPLDGPAFVRQYGRERFGFNAAAAVRFQKALYKNGKEASGVLKALKPKRNPGEFAHFSLMADIRAWFLEYKAVDTCVQSPAFPPAEKKRLARKLAGLLSGHKDLARRYAALQKGFLFPGEIETENQVRERPVRLLHDRLAGKR